MKHGQIAITGARGFLGRKRSDDIAKIHPAHQVEVLENAPSEGIRTIKVKDTQAVDASSKPFMRLNLVQP